MKVAILAGGLGTRIAEESHLKPKPMIEIGGKPIIWHIMKGYSHFGFNDFVILAGYKQEVIKDYFANYFLYNSDVTFRLSDNKIDVHNVMSEDWSVTVLDTGLKSMTGARVKVLEKYIEDASFMLTYGDAVSDIDINQLLRYHKRHGKIATITTVSNVQGKGVLDINTDGEVMSFREKIDQDSVLINGGYMIFEREIFRYIDDSELCVLEEETMTRLVEDHQLMAYHHKGFWQCMDTKKEMDQLEYYWSSGEAPWEIWR